VEVALLDPVSSLVLAVGRRRWTVVYTRYTWTQKRIQHAVF